MILSVTDISFALAAITLLSGLVSVITQVIKMNTNKISPILVSTIVGLILTIGAVICYCMMNGIAVSFPVLFIAFCASWVVILTSNVGFDKVKQYFTGLKIEDLNKKKNDA